MNYSIDVVPAFPTLAVKQDTVASATHNDTRRSNSVDSGIDIHVDANTGWGIGHCAGRRHDHLCESDLSLIHI